MVRRTATTASAPSRASIAPASPALPTGTDFGNFVLLGNHVDLCNMTAAALPRHGRRRLKVCGDTDVPFPAKDHHLSQNELLRRCLCRAHGTA